MIEFADSAKLHKHTQYYKLQNAGSFGNCQFKNQGKNNSTNLGEIGVDRNPNFN